jgi:hypothetical protein
MSESKPKIYISSTIYDFRDLRSALKYWLEGLGYEVMLSEFNDFTKPLDENSYTACLRAVEQANYFILLIGARVGGFYATPQKVSITRMEYRTAYELLLSKKIKLVTFVREDLWNVREDRNALRDFLINDYKAHREIDTTDIHQIVRHPSKFVNDVEATFDFLNEVSRANEMKQAMAGRGDFPVGNWIHQFSTFEDITKTLSALFGTGRRLSRVALITNLKRELLSNLIHLTSKSKDKRINLHTFYADLARKHFKGGWADSSSMPSRYVKWLVMYLIAKVYSKRLSTQFIDQALTSGEFLEFDFELNSYKIGQMHDALFQLKRQVAQLNSFGEGYLDERVTDFILKYSPKNNPSVNGDGDMFIDNEELVVPLACYDCEMNVAILCIALLKALDGDYSRLTNLQLRPPNPIESEAERIEQENATIEELIEWVKEQ